ncbi:conserved hypothetical protein [Kyrpidia tusciae DSM 2912]|uniref:Uncharacterized protein n=1 Tax=Kyrpidia tusciae (strain DSM 2912 / NBRC 15312 / T2) TaxID=562970 RepID=D5WU65_KYRT2|nr:conserved hypothetical protein [Kyrpidia tusciae DSM 2912]
MTDRRGPSTPDKKSTANPEGEKRQTEPRQSGTRPGGGGKNRRDRSGFIGFAAATAFFTALLGRMVAAGPVAANTDWNASGQAPSSATIHAGLAPGQSGPGGAPSTPGASGPGSGETRIDPGTLPPGPDGSASAPGSSGAGDPPASGRSGGDGSRNAPGDNGQGSDPGFVPDYGPSQAPPGSFGPPAYGPPAMSPPVDGITGAS